MLSAASLWPAVPSVAWKASNAVTLSANCNPMLNLKNLIHSIIAFSTGGTCTHFFYQGLSHDIIEIPKTQWMFTLFYIDSFFFFFLPVQRKRTSRRNRKQRSTSWKAHGDDLSFQAARQANIHLESATNTRSFLLTDNSESLISFNWGKFSPDAMGLLLVQVLNRKQASWDLDLSWRKKK